MNRNGQTSGAARILILTLGPLLFLTSYATADDSTATNEREGLYGEWYFPKIEEVSGMTQVASLVIEQSRITTTNRCSHRGGTVAVRVASPAQITANQLTVLEAKHDSKGNFPNCEVSLVRGTVSYRVQNGGLLLFDPDSGETAEFTSRAP